MLKYGSISGIFDVLNIYIYILKEDAISLHNCLFCTSIKKNAIIKSHSLKVILSQGIKV